MRTTLDISRTVLSAACGGPLARLALTLVLVLLVSPAAWAQSSGISGAVRDTTGGVLPGVTVEARSPVLIEGVRSAVTDGQGVFAIVELEPGTYSVTFTLPGFSTLIREGIELTTGFTAAVNADMAVGAVEETITVTGATPVVDIRNVATQAVVTREVIDAIPSGKNFSNLGALIPGVSTWTNLGGQDSGGALGNDGQMLIIHGSRTSDQLVRIDGMPMGMLDGSGAPPLGTPSDGMTQETVLSIGSHNAEVETGGVYVNIIPRIGSNMYSGGLFGSFANSGLQWDNLTDELKGGGVAASGIVRNTDLNPTFGGPLARDRLWFFVSYRDRRSVRQFSLLPDRDNSDWVFTPDTGNPMDDEHLNWDVSARITWQASERHKFTFAQTVADDCWCTHILGSAVGVTPVATNYSHWPNKHTQLSWSAPLTDRLLLEAAGQVAFAGWDGQFQPNAVFPAAVEQTTGFQFRAGSHNLGFQDTKYGNHFARFALSYVTGSHNFKFGTTVFPASNNSDHFSGADYEALLLNGMPDSVRYLAFPYTSHQDVLKLGAFAQDQWTIDRLTVNLGVRYDSIDTSYPDYDLAATGILPARSFPGADVLSWKDFSPRMGLAYDVFGDGRTALKASLSRYVQAETHGTTKYLADPTFAAGGKLTRSWNDANGDFVPQGDPLNPDANGEIGRSPNPRWGQPAFFFQLDPDWARGGFGSRGYQWEFSTSIQRELLSGVSVDLGYFRRTYGNFIVLNDQDIAPEDYDPYCVTAPTDSRLPGGGGHEICDLYDLNPSALGRAFNFVRTLSGNFGDQYESHHSVDLTVDARLDRLLLQGGMSTSKGVSDNCDVVTKLDNPSTRFCHSETQWLTQVKFLGAYTLPYDIEIAATYTDVPGIGIPNTPEFGLGATYVATNAVIAPSLGRNLAYGSVRTLPLLEPGSLYQDRLRQFDLRIGKTFTMGGTQLKAMVDFYNLFNSSTSVLLTDTYGVTGAAWLQTQQILLARYAKLGVQIDF